MILDLGASDSKAHVLHCLALLPLETVPPDVDSTRDGRGCIRGGTYTGLWWDLQFSFFSL